MIRETVYTTLGAAALAADFVTSPARQQNWLKKAERRGGKVAQSVRPVQRRIENVIDDVRNGALGTIGLAERKVERTATTARRTATRTASRASKATPRVKVATRRTTARRSGATRRVRRTTVSLQTPASKAS
ncbi:MAG: hypothetical protein NVSMB17_02180 [Candidatus Dormibacteria bacterium]